MSTFTEAGLLAKTGLNDAGLGVTLNFLASDADGGLDGMPIHLLLRMLLEEGTDHGDRIPDTLQALISARIDRLPAGEKILLQRGSIIGRVFWPGALAALSPEYDADDAWPIRHSG